jgi:hypothetical protein
MLRSFGAVEIGEAMTSQRDGALLAHIADTVTEMCAEQTTMLAVLARLVEIGETQTEMLTEILGAAHQEPGPSETTRLLAELVLAVQENTAAVAGIAEQMASLPAEISAEVADALGGDLDGPGGA